MLRYATLAATLAVASYIGFVAWMCGMYDPARFNE
jgi:hypothetical protein